MYWISLTQYQLTQKIPGLPEICSSTLIHDIYIFIDKAVKVLNILKLQTIDTMIHPIVGPVHIK